MVSCLQSLQHTRQVNALSSGGTGVGNDPFRNLPETAPAFSLILPKIEQHYRPYMYAGSPDQIHTWLGRFIVCQEFQRYCLVRQ
jgi:hypothetical protein